MGPTVREHPDDISSADRASTLRDVSEQAANAAKAAQSRLSDAASDATSALQDKGARIAEGAQEVASQMKDHLQEKIEAQKDAGADYVLKIAEAMRRAAREFEHDVPIAAEYIGLAASTVDEYAERFRSGDLGDMVKRTKEFARRQPTAFLGLTFLAGFGLVRLLKSSAANSNEADDGEAAWREDDARTSRR